MHRLLIRLTEIIWIVFPVIAWPLHAEPGEFNEAGVLEPLADDFPNRPITLVTDSDAASRDGIYARALQAAAQGISPVPILISDEPGPVNASWIKLQSLSERSGGEAGYYPMVTTIPGMTLQFLVEPFESKLGVDLDDLNMVLVTETVPYVLIQRKNAPWGRTFAGLVEYARAHQGELRYTSNQVGSGNDIAMEWIMHELGFTVRKIPSPNNHVAAAAVGAGEADFTMTQAEVAVAHFRAGRIDVVLVTGDSVPPPWKDDPSVVSAEEAGLPPAPWGIMAGLAVPKKTDDEHVQWLFKLFSAAAAKEAYRLRENTIPGTKIQILGPEEANVLKHDVFSTAEPIIRKLNLHHEQRR